MLLIFNKSWATRITTKIWCNFIFQQKRNKQNITFELFTCNKLDAKYC